MQKLKRYLLNFAGGAIGIATYQLLTAPMVGGFHLVSTLIISTVFGAIFGLIASIFATRLVHFVYSGFATSLMIGAAILSIVGTEHLDANLANNGWVEVLIGIVGMSFLSGFGGLLATNLSPLKNPA
ncbi:MAG: hypothetical protein P4L53_14415 [Candidatus Obscuribacterales bacterium]|nr:hypothetical protein [Candidatus Obscuribacterales bacterium]